MIPMFFIGHFILAQDAVARFLSLRKTFFVTITVIRSVNMAMSTKMLRLRSIILFWNLNALAVKARQE